MEQSNPYTSTVIANDVPAPYSAYRRLTVFLVCIVLSTPALAASAMFAAGLAVQSISRPLGYKLTGFDVLANVVVVLAIYAWTAFMVMGICWIRDRTVARHWPVLGTIAGVICVLACNVFSVTVIPAVILAIHLVRYHWAHSKARAGAST